MTFRPAYDGITLAHGDIAVRLRPSLRAASSLVQTHGDLASVFRRLGEFHTGTVREIITVATTDRSDAAAFLHSVAKTPVRQFLEIAQAPLASLCLAFVPAPDPDRKHVADGKMIPLTKLYRELYRLATGWLHWTPDTAWNATPTEITEALAGHNAKLRAIYGGKDSEAADDQPDLNASAKLDRDGLARLRGKGRLR